MDKIMKNKKGVEVVTSLSSSCEICLDKFIFGPDPLNLKTVERKGKENSAKYSTSQEWKELFKDKIMRSFILISFIYSLKI